MTTTATRFSASSTQSFSFIVQDLTGKQGDTGCPVRPLMVPEGMSYLLARPGQPPQVQAHEPESGSNVFILEPIRRDRQLRLLLVSPTADRVLLNAAPAPRVAVLQVKDQLTLADGRLLLVLSMYVRPYVGGPKPETIGRKCSLCHIAIEATARVYVCCFCGEPLHCEKGPDQDPEAGLQCAATTTTCPACLNDIVKTEGLTHIPEEMTGG
ncbi:MAG: hypothetical protein ACYS0G_11800 [Planctomycetota bacterium]|jgi:hypothetical protein